MEHNQVILFKGKNVRRVIHNNEWYFVIVDIIEALTDSVDPSGYLRDLRRRDIEIQTKLMRPEVNIVYSLKDLASEIKDNYLSYIK